MLPPITDPVPAEKRPIRVLQFGEGNFLRGFVDYMLDIANEQGVFNGSAAIIKAVPFGSLEHFQRQHNRYTVCLRGKLDGQVINTHRIISCIDRAIDCYTAYADYMALSELDTLKFVVSNTTEAGIVFDDTDRFESEPPTSFPGKLTKFLHARWLHFGGASDKGLVMLPVELIEDNGRKLKACVLRIAMLWHLEEAFIDWIHVACCFCTTLVDRIVTGYPKEEAEQIFAELGYTDALLDIAEPFGLWVIETSNAPNLAEQFPLHKAGLPVIFIDNQRPYRERKVRILNGAHTSTVLSGFLMGLDTVGECMQDATLRSFMERAVLHEIVPTVPLPSAEANAFAAAVFERFENPFVKHLLLSIALNSVSKWSARILPSLKDYLRQNGNLPPCLTFSFAALLAFYTSDMFNPQNTALIGKRAGLNYPISDSEEVLTVFARHSGKPPSEYVWLVMSHAELWGTDLTVIPHFATEVSQRLSDIAEHGMRLAMQRLLAAEV